MDTLVQVIATFLSVGAAFTAAYLIYLFSAQSNVDQEIQILGSQIAEALKKKSKVAIPCFDGEPLTKAYLEKHTDKTRLDALLGISSRLLSASLAQDHDAKQSLSLFQETNGKGPFEGRIFLWLLHEFVYELAPEVMRTRQVGFSRNVDLVQVKRSELFPSGPIGAEQWAEDCTAILNALNFLLANKDAFIGDVEEYVNGVDPESKDWWRQFRWKEIVAQIGQLVSDLRAQNERLCSLTRLRKNYSISVRFPHAKKVIIFWLLSFLVGVLFPTITTALNLDCIFASITKHYLAYVSSVLGLAFLFLAIGVLYVKRDVFSPDRLLAKEEFLVRTALPLEKQLIEEDKQEFAEYDYLLINRALKEKFIIDKKKLAKQLKVYRDAVVDSNACSKQIVEPLSKKLKTSKLLKKYQIQKSSGGTGLNLFHLLYLDRRKRLLQSIKKTKGNLIFEIVCLRRSRTVMAIRQPSPENEKAEVLSEIEALSDDLLGSGQIKTCLGKRERAKKERKKLLKLLKEAIEND